MFNFPLFVQLTDKEVVIVGGGQVAYRKAKKLLSSSASITVVAPKLHPDLQSIHQNGNIRWIKERCKPEHLTSAFMIVSASGNKEAQEIIRSTAHPFQLVNGADQPSIGNVSFPASFEEDGVHIAVSTHGKDPSLAKKIKHRLKEWFQRNNDLS